MTEIQNVDLGGMGGLIWGFWAVEEDLGLGGDYKSSGLISG